MEVSPVHGFKPSSLKTQTKKLAMNGDLFMPIRWRPLENLQLKPKAKAQDQGLPKLSIVSELFDNKEGTGRGGRTKEWFEKKEGTSRGGRTKELYDNNEGGTSRGGRAKEEHDARTCSKDHNDKVNGNGVPINGIMINNKKASTNGNGANMAQMGSASEQNMKSKEQEEGPMVSAMKVLSTSPSGSSVCVHTGIMREELTSSLWPGGGAASASSAVDIGSGNYLRLMQQGGLPYLLQEEPKLPLRKEEGPGLGIVDFLKGKNIFITGATGFLAKVLVEKVLRVQPDVGKLFLLIKAKELNEAKRRLRGEILYSHLFNQLQTKYGEAYIQHMEAKLIPVVGNIEKDNLGMDAQTMDALQNKLDLIINSAASTTFDERYDHAINLNTKGAQRVVDFALSCSRLQLFVHVSTAFVNGKREGLVQEKAFKIGCSITNETTAKDGKMAPDINLDVESSLIQERRVHVLKENQTNGSLFDDDEKLLQQAMKELGMERAKAYGWQDTYVFTKAMGEMLIDSGRGKLPVVIVRPSVVESSFKDPFPGWMEGNRMMDPIIISYGKGQLPGFLVDPKSVLDVVPVDMVANAMLAAMTRHANKPGLEVYQVASSVVNPLKFSQLARLSQEHFLEHPFMDNIGKPILASHLELFQDMDSFVQAITNCSTPQKDAMTSTSDTRALLKRHRQLTVKVKQQAVYLANLYRPYTFYAGRFDTSNTQGLLASLSYQEKQLFGFDLTEIDWDTYIKRIHIPGLKKHVLKGRGSNV